MLKGFAANGCMDGAEEILEIITEIKWAGADIIISYHAKEEARWVNNEK